jgi:hypothetical protein
MRTLAASRLRTRPTKKIMTETQSLAIDILNLVPDDSTCFINAPSLTEDSDISKLLQPTSRDHYDGN